MNIDNIQLTEDQESAFNYVKKFINDNEEPAIVIKGSAGTGKTTLTKYIVNYIVDNKNLSIVAIAPTHKAKRVLWKMLNNNRFIPIQTMTIASILGKMREHTYIGTHKYTNGSRQKMDKFDLFILDEVSMVSDTDLDYILDYICKHDKQIILIGDDCQIPSPSQQYVINGYDCYKPDSSAFDIIPLCHLQKIVRQASNSPIIRIATYLREHIYEDNNLDKILFESNVNKEDLCVNFKNLYNLYIEDMKNKLNTRIIAYTNAAVRYHNLEIRNKLKYDKPFIIGDILTGYNNVGFPEPIIENGTDYVVKDLREISNYSIREFRDLNGFYIKLQDVDNEDNNTFNLFFISIKHNNNIRFMNELVRRAELVNKKNSSKEDFRKYYELKNGAIFIEDVYKYGNHIMSETTFRELHPLLFTKINEVINIQTRNIYENELSTKIDEMYTKDDIISSRVNDNKPFGDSEVFADKFMVVEKDIYYGYAITAHKSQGSTYDSVYVDDMDFEKLSNKWNFKLRVIENRHKEKNQLKYVAYTRASKKLKIVIH